MRGWAVMETMRQTDNMMMTKETLQIVQRTFSCSEKEAEMMLATFMDGNILSILPHLTIQNPEESFTRHVSHNGGVRWTNADSHNGSIPKPEEAFTRRVHQDGTIRWTNSDRAFHRLDGPAVDRPNGEKEWYVNGKHHREGGPAIEWNNGTKEWFVNGKRHRLDGPALEYADGTKKWYFDGRLHRHDGPAIEWNNGTKEWFVNGKRHRLDGPAIEMADGYNEWYVDDHYVNITAIFGCEPVIPLSEEQQMVLRRATQ